MKRIENLTGQPIMLPDETILDAHGTLEVELDELHDEAFFEALEAIPNITILEIQE